MIRWDKNTRLRVVRVVLLICIFLTGCGQSIPQYGESVDSVSSWNGTNGVARGSGESGDRTQQNSQQRTPSEQSIELDTEETSLPQEPPEPQDRGTSVDHSSSEQPEAEDKPSDEVADEQQIPEKSQQMGTEDLEDLAIQEQMKPEVTAAQEQTAGPAVEERQDRVEEERQEGAAVDRQDRQDPEPSSSNSVNTPSNEQKSSNSANAPNNEQKPSNSANAPNNEQKKQLEWDGDNTLTFGELYASVGVRGIVLSDKVEALTDQEVEMSGYMAPPLTAGVRFFVLTKTLMAVCPFCSTDADWPTDIVVVYLPDGEEMNPTEHPVKVTGTLETGSYRDDDTGFVSLVRIYADKVEVLR